MPSNDLSIDCLPFRTDLARRLKRETRVLEVRSPIGNLCHPFKNNQAVPPDENRFRFRGIRLSLPRL